MDAYLYEALRTPRTKARENGSLAALPPSQLVSTLVAELGLRGLDTQHCEQLILGCVGQIKAQGGNIALASKLHAGLPDSCSAMTLNHYCVSGLSSIGVAANACALGQQRLVLAGGVECMSQVPFMADKAAYYSDRCLPPRLRYMPVALSADLLANKEDVSRAELDAVTAESHRRAVCAEDYQHSRITIRDEAGSVLADSDECIRAGSSEEQLATMPAAFAELAAQYAEAIDGRTLEHVHSVANAPPMVDGAALAVIGGKSVSDVFSGVKPRARILGWTDAAADPVDSLTGGMAAMDKLLAAHKLRLADIDRIEFMEAFAVVPVLLSRRYEVDNDKVNVSGGHLAKGHPMGATGAVLLSTLCDVLEQDDKTLGLVVATGAGGVGSAMLIERMR